MPFHLLILSLSNCEKEGSEGVNAYTRCRWTPRADVGRIAQCVNIERVEVVYAHIVYRHFGVSPRDICTLPNTHVSPIRAIVMSALHMYSRHVYATWRGLSRKRIVAQNACAIPKPPPSSSFKWSQGCLITCCVM